MKSKVIVISPNPYSRYTLTTLYLLKRMDIQVSAVISLKLLNVNRIFSEFRRDGGRLFKKVYRKLILKGSENTVSGNDNIVSFMSESDMPFIPVPKYCKENNIQYVTTANLNNDKVHNLLDEHKPDCIAFTGGGLLRKGIIERSGKGVINCHMGILPFYRGMDVVQWPILNKDFDNIGMTTHIIDRGVDTGDILEVVKIDPSNYPDLKSLRNAFERLMPQVLAKTCEGLLNGDMQPKSQSPQDGIQHFVTNKRLSPLIDQLLQSQKS
jgi:methionyl-tRNA formyltransferase